MSVDELFVAVRDLSSSCGDRVREMVGSQLGTTLKSDKTFVTKVDLEIEKMVRDFVTVKFPDHGIVGEENEDVRPDADYQWIVDPIDGTQNLVHGIPTYGIVIGVFHKGQAMAGAINHPALKLEYYGAKGKGCFRNGERILIQDTKLVDGQLDSQEIVSLSTRSIFERSKEESIFDQLVKEYPAHRVYYDIFSSTRAIEGQAAVMVEFNMKIWDFAATEILVTEAGGAFEIVRNVSKENSKPMYSLIAGKPSAVKLMVEKFGGFKKIAL